MLYSFKQRRVRAGGMRGVRGFTLIELLVVIAIITALAAMMMPVFSKVRGRGRDSKCRANLKQLHTASMNYLYDSHYHTRHLPFASSREWFDAWNETYYEVVGWVRWLNYKNQGGKTRKPGDPPPWWGDKARRSIREGHIWPYSGMQMKIYMCPEFQREIVCGKADNPINEPFDPVRSYVMNGDGRASGATLEGMGHANNVLMFADGHTHSGDRVGGKRVCRYGLKEEGRLATVEPEIHEYAMDGQLWGKDEQNQNFPLECVGTFHGGRGNAIFVDGHIERLPNARHPDIVQATIDACAGNW